MYKHTSAARKERKNLTISYDEEQIKASQFVMLLYLGIFKGKSQGL